MVVCVCDCVCLFVTRLREIGFIYRPSHDTFNRAGLWITPLTLGTGNYSAILNNMKLVRTLAVDRWAVTFGTVRRDSPSINGQCTNHRIAV